MSYTKRLLKLMEGNRVYFVIALAATGAVAFCSTINPMIIRLTVDSIIDNKPLDVSPYISFIITKLGGLSVLAQNLWILGISIVTVTLVNGIFQFTRGTMTSRAAESMAKKLKDRLYDHIQKLPYNFHVKAQTGDLIQRCTSDVETIRRFFAVHLIEMGRTIFLVGIVLPIMFSLNVKLALVSMIIMPVVFFMSIVFFTNIKRTFKLADEKEGELSTVLQESLTGVRVVRAFGRQRFELDKFTKRNDEFTTLNMKIIQYMAVYWSLSDMLSIFQFAFITAYGIILITRGELSVGTLILFTSYEGMLIWPIRQLGRILSDMGKMQVSLNRVYEILQTPEEKDPEGRERPDLRGDIVFSDISFEYEAGKPVLSDLSFTVKKNETVAILGNTGSGKSTILHLLLRLYDYRDGSITVNGVELKHIEKSWLREKIGLVLQEPFLYSKTIKNNLKMARDEVADEDIFDATRTASVHDVIEGFELGYETLVGERGVTLSGGQKQRVAIARTLIKNSQILIFDDSLSAVDTETDAQIRKALREHRGDTVTFIISQRITTLMEADRILVLEHGRITDFGTHEELANRPGLYKRIWDIQTALEVEEA